MLIALHPLAGRGAPAIEHLFRCVVPVPLDPPLPQWEPAAILDLQDAKTTTIAVP